MELDVSLKSIHVDELKVFDIIQKINESLDSIHAKEKHEFATALSVILRSLWHSFIKEFCDSIVKKLQIENINLWYVSILQRIFSNLIRLDSVPPWNKLEIQECIHVFDSILPE